MRKISRRETRARLISVEMFDYSVVYTPELVNTQLRRSKVSNRQAATYLFRRGEVRSVGAGTVLGGGGAAGDLVRVGQRAALHLGQHALLVQRGLEEPGVAVELHQVEDLQREKRGKKRKSGERWKRAMGE